jgi:putative transposase
LLELIEMPNAAGSGEVRRRLLGGRPQAVVDAEVSAFIGAVRHERSEVPHDPTDRDSWQATHDGRWGSAGEDPEGPDRVVLPVRCPRRGAGSTSRSMRSWCWLLEGLSTRRVDDLVMAMGVSGISKSEMSRICAHLDADVAAWRTKTVDHSSLPFGLWTVT